MKKQTPWMQHVETWRSSGLTQAEYCRQHGLAAKSFSFWLGRRAKESDLSSVDLIPVQIVPTDKAPKPVSTVKLKFKAVELELSTEVSPRWFAELLQCLA